MQGDISIGVSACLLGEAVRYDGRHKLTPFIRDFLGHHFRLLPVCPEAGSGLGVPRAPIELMDTGGDIHARGVDDCDFDVTRRILEFAERRVAHLGGISGYVFKSRSPSCGLGTTPVRDGSGRVVSHGDGLYTGRIRERLPGMPCEEESGFGDRLVAEGFIERVLAYRRWQALRSRGPAGRARFDAAHRLFFEARGVAPPSCRAPDYIRSFSERLRRPATAAGQAAVLGDILDQLAPDLDGDDVRQLRGLLDSLRNGESSRYGLTDALNLAWASLGRRNAAVETYLGCPSALLGDAAARFLSPTE